MPPRCDVCAGLIKAGRACVRCANRAEAVKVRAVEESKRDQDARRAREESAACSAAKRSHLMSYVRKVLSLARGPERAEFQEANPFRGL